MWTRFGRISQHELGYLSTTEYQGPELQCLLKVKKDKLIIDILTYCIKC